MIVRCDRTTENVNLIVVMKANIPRRASQFAFLRQVAHENH